MDIDLKKLAKFLVKAKKETYATGGKEAEPQRPGFKELEFSEGDFNYRDSYIGFYAAPGQEIVRFKGVPIWSMAYDGETMKKFRKKEFASDIFTFLKKALMRVDESKPFRGPERFEEDDFLYTSEVTGDIKRFNGHERILYKGEEVFSQNYFGGLIIHKEN
jgi:hypothetical protein